MDRLSIAGLIVALFAIYLGFVIEGGAISALFELPAFIIVFGGTVGAVYYNPQKSSFYMQCHFCAGCLRPLSLILTKALMILLIGTKGTRIWLPCARKYRLRY